MARRSLLSAAAQKALLSTPSDPTELHRYYLLCSADHELIQSRRGDENQIGLAVHIALLRYPGHGWLESDQLSDAFTGWLGQQLNIDLENLTAYAKRGATKTAHNLLAMDYLGLSSFGEEHFEPSVALATKAAFSTDHGGKVIESLMEGLRARRLVLPRADTLERLALKGRARARREAATALFDALSLHQRDSIQELLVNDPVISQTRLTWLRGYSNSTSPASMKGLLERLKYLRGLNLPSELGQDIHPARLTKFACEGAVAPVSLLKDFGERRRIATIAAQMMEFSVTITDASIAMFERLTGQLFSCSRNRPDQVRNMGKNRVGKLMQLFGEAIDTMSRAQELGLDSFDALDSEVGWLKLLKTKDEIASFGESATSDPLTLATERYAYMRKFVPAFLEVLNSIHRSRAKASRLQLAC